eukprot:TRINITY_DN66451_c0_g1_i1.p1 TRINITY_DN66451_c0_g1~~TRINITY_DN66451_c0_g1_i1.p1  ORF type:complete len:470 (+),score=183.59 TRINITY_DN66451_c0_g1_i1:164-1573(+)
MFSTFGWSGQSDEQLREHFDELDNNKSGKLEKEEVERALKNAGKTEEEAKNLTAALPEAKVDFETFKELVHGKSMFSSMTSALPTGIPGAGYLPSIPGTAAWRDLPEEDLRKLFGKFDQDSKEAITKAHLDAALREVGASEADAAKVVARAKSDAITFDKFKLLMKPHTVANPLHDIPGLGMVTSGFSDAFGSAFGSLGINTSDEQSMREAFDRIDVDKSNTLSKDEVADALRSMGKSEREISCLVDAMPGGNLNFEGFKELLKPKPISASMPGLPLPSMASLMPAGWANLSEEELQAKFKELDLDGSGNLDKKEIEKLLQDLGRSEEEIKKDLARMKEDKITYDQFRLMAKAPRWQNPVHDIPGVGLLTSALSDTFASMDEKELREAFEKIDADKNGKLDKVELRDVLKEMGKTDSQVETMLESLPDDYLDFEAFKAHVTKQTSWMPGMPGMPSMGMPSMFSGGYSSS